MARWILGVTGSVAAVRVPSLVEGLRLGGHEVRVVATEPSLYFFDPSAVDGPAEGAGGRVLLRDADEWPPPAYQRDDAVLHIELRKWADALLAAPLDANTLAKFALGMADNLLSCLFRAWDFQKPIVLAPAMNTLMWQSPVTLRHFRQILEDRGDGLAPTGWGLERTTEIYARHLPGIRVVGPIAKGLACGDVGMGGMAEVAELMKAVEEVVNSGIGRA